MVLKKQQQQNIKLSYKGKNVNAYLTLKTKVYLRIFNLLVKGLLGFPEKIHAYSDAIRSEHFFVVLNSVFRDEAFLSNTYKSEYVRNRLMQNLYIYFKVIE